MRKRGVYLIVVGLVIVGMFVLVFRNGESEPEYGEKKLSEWVEGYENAIVTAKYGDMTEWDRTDAAVRHIGTNALPFLRQWFRYEAGPRKMKVYAVVNALLQALNGKWAFRDHREIRANYVLVAMRALGARMDTAEIAELSGAMKDPNAYWSAMRAMDLLVSFGEYSSLVPGLTNRHERVRWRAANGIASMGTNAVSAVPDLLRLLHDPDADARETATNALRKIDPQALESAGK